MAFVARVGQSGASGAPGCAYLFPLCHKLVVGETEFMEKQQLSGFGPILGCTGPGGEIAPARRAQAA